MVHKTFLWRLVLALCMGSLWLLALAYYWLDNTVHEWIGTAIFGLLITHNLLHRRWWSSIAKPRRVPGARFSKFDMALTLLLLAVMLALLWSSLMISQTVFSSLQLAGAFTARQVHFFAAYWAMVLVSVHLGLRWQRVMHGVRSACHLADKNTHRTVVLRLLAGTIAAYGVRSSWVMEVGTKLTLQTSLEWWDFERSTLGFFAHWLSIAGLYIFLTHYFLRWTQRRPNTPTAALEPHP